MIKINSIRFVFSLLYKFTPSLTISTFFRTGHLPEWQQYWTSFGATVLLNLILFVQGSFFDYSSSEIAISPHASFTALMTGSFLLIVSIISILSLHTSKPSSSSSNEITAHIATFQLITTSLTLPVTQRMSAKAYSLFDFFCVQALPCASWIISLMKFLISTSIPMFFFMLITSFNPWPSAFLQTRYNNAFSIMTEGFIIFFYTMLLMYSLGFLFFRLSIPEAGFILKSLFATRVQ